VAVIAGAAGVAVGAIKGISSSNTEQQRYDMQLAYAQQQLANGQQVGGVASAGLESIGAVDSRPGVGTQSRSINAIVNQTMTALDTDNDGKIVVADAPAGIQRLLAYVDSRGSKSGIVTAEQLRSALKEFDMRSDGTLDQVDLAIMVATVKQENSPIVAVRTTPVALPSTSTKPPTASSSTTAPVAPTLTSSDAATAAAHVAPNPPAPTATAAATATHAAPASVTATTAAGTPVLTGL
ncbi:MAG: hypothetical protein H7123_09070, partial [Thermoleophilia bacterium]|nr:hypothetical protein [Thermoleophilia bacterium]